MATATKSPLDSFTLDAVADASYVAPGHEADVAEHAETLSKDLKQLVTVSKSMDTSARKVAVEMLTIGTYCIRENGYPTFNFAEGSGTFYAVVGAEKDAAEDSIIGKLLASLSDEDRPRVGKLLRGSIRAAAMRARDGAITEYVVGNYFAEGTDARKDAFGPAGPKFGTRKEAPYWATLLDPVPPAVLEKLREVYTACGLEPPVFYGGNKGKTRANAQKTPVQAVEFGIESLSKLTIRLAEHLVLRGVSAMIQRGLKDRQEGKHWEGAGTVSVNTWTRISTMSTNYAQILDGKGDIKNVEAIDANQYNPAKDVTPVEES